MSTTNSETLRAAVVVIGNEVLSGRTQDANTQFIAGQLNQRGIAVVEVRIVPDVEVKIIKAINELRGEVDYVFTTGGIGPTHDDITADSIAKAFGVGLVTHPDALRVMEDHYGTKDLSPPRLKMAMIPDGASLILNPVSGAPGFAMGNVYVMAGVPRIMQGMLENILPLLREGAQILTNTVACSLRESEIAARLTEIQNDYSDVDIGSYPQYRQGPHNLSLVLRSTNAARLKQATRKVMDMIRDLGDEPSTLGLQAEIE
ncbi:MAG: molybdopterin-binding protein [Alphaproteobacteria bacterium]